MRPLVVGGADCGRRHGDAAGQIIMTAATGRSGRRWIVEVAGVERRGEARIGGGQRVGGAGVIGGEAVGVGGVGVVGVGLGTLAQHVRVVGG